MTDPIATARLTVTRLNRRVQQAEAALADAQRIIDRLAGRSDRGTIWCGGSMGRRLLAWQNQRLREALMVLLAELHQASVNGSSRLDEAERVARFLIGWHPPAPREGDNESRDLLVWLDRNLEDEQLDLEPEDLRGIAGAVLGRDITPDETRDLIRPHLLARRVLARADRELAASQEPPATSHQPPGGGA